MKITVRQKTHADVCTVAVGAQDAAAGSPVTPAGDPDPCAPSVGPSSSSLLRGPDGSGDPRALAASVGGG